MSVDLEHIAGQIGTATMDYLSGKIIKVHFSAVPCLLEIIIVFFN